jgi:hypothetical protein
MQYGDKRDYPKINIYVNRNYRCSTTWAATCKEAVEHFKASNPAMPSFAKVTAFFEHKYKGK